MQLSESTRERTIKLARGIADWLYINQVPTNDADGNAGAIPFSISSPTQWERSCQWNVAFACMGWLGAYKAFGNEKYYDAAMSGGRYLKSLQIFNPFMKEHYGAIRERSPQTPWVYPRDGLSAAWAFIELYRHTNDEEYLERARLWGEWFLRVVLDEDGWPFWCIQFDELFQCSDPPVSGTPNFSNHLQGCFHGGGLNFFYQLAMATGDKKWTGDFFARMADYFVDHIQQEDGFFRSIDRKTKEPPRDDPQDGLHRANDDFGTLGLLCAYNVTKNVKYLKAIEKFITAVFARQDDSGMFESSVACIPVIVNIVHELKQHGIACRVNDEAIDISLVSLCDAEISRTQDPSVHGALNEFPKENRFIACARSNCYALIVLLKVMAGVEGFLCVQPVHEAH